MYALLMGQSQQKWYYINNDKISYIWIAISSQWQTLLTSYFQTFMPHHFSMSKLIWGLALNVTPCQLLSQRLIHMHSCISTPNVTKYMYMYVVYPIYTVNILNKVICLTCLHVALWKLTYLLALHWQRPHTWVWLLHNKLASCQEMNTWWT